MYDEIIFHFHDQSFIRKNLFCQILCYVHDYDHHVSVQKYVHVGIHVHVQVANAHDYCDYAHFHG